MKPQSENYVDIFKVRFPRMNAHQALDALMDRFQSKQSTSVCFIDMSAMNQAMKHSKLHRIYQGRSFNFNDGVGMSFAAWQQGKPFPENLNGTDICPMFLRSLPKGTKIYMVGSYPELIQRSFETFQKQYPHLNFVGCHHGYFNSQEEEKLVEELKEKKPRIVLVGMGNPQQALFIDRHLDDPKLKGVMWFAIGGLLHYFSGDLLRAPESFRKRHLEWLYILAQQPHKLTRYVFGIPLFLVRSCWAYIRNEHEAKR